MKHQQQFHQNQCQIFIKQNNDEKNILQINKYNQSRNIDAKMNIEYNRYLINLFMDIFNNNNNNKLHSLNIWLEKDNFDSDDHDDSNIYCYFIHKLNDKMDEYEILKTKIKNITLNIIKFDKN